MPTWASFRLSSAAVFAGASLLFAPGAKAQNVFVSCLPGIFEVAPDGTKTFFANAGYEPLGLAFDTSGDLFAASYGADPNTGQIYEFVNDDGVLSTTPVVVASGLDYPVGLAFNLAGNLFVSESGNGIIGEITGGTVSTYAHGPNGAQGISFFGDDLYVANRTLDTVSEVSTTGTFTTLASGLSSPAGLVAEGTLLYVSNEQGNSIDEIRPVALKGAGPITYVSGLNDPNGIVFSGKTLYEADTGSGEINEFTTTVTGLHTTITETNLTTGLDDPGWLAIQPVPEPAFFGLAAVSGIAFFIRRRISR